MAQKAPVDNQKSRVYWIALLALFLGLSLCREIGIRAVQMSCWAGGYRQNAWMAYCNSSRYGVYDVDAIWHHVEPDVLTAVNAAKILTLTDSHLQNALSLGGASEWFAARHYPLYMLGLPTEESGFGERLIDNLHPHARLVILDASPYFSGEVGAIERGTSDGAAALHEVLGLRDFQVEHRDFCERFGWACGHNFSYFRSKVDGHWIFPPQTRSIWIGYRDVPNDVVRQPANSRPNEQLPLYPKYLLAATRLIEKLNLPRECIVITQVPAADDLRGLAAYLSRSLGITLVDPEVPDLYTFDAAHLSPESSIRWTNAFLRGLEPVLHRCLDGEDHALR
jgi:hypothetical protein